MAKYLCAGIADKIIIEVPTSGTTNNLMLGAGINVCEYTFPAVPPNFWTGGIVMSKPSGGNDGSQKTTKV